MLNLSEMLGKRKFDKLFWGGNEFGTLVFLFNRASCFDSFFVKISSEGYENERSADKESSPG